MEKDARITIDEELGKISLDEMILSIVTQALAASEGNRHRAARKLDITTDRVDRTLRRFRRPEERAADHADLKNETTHDANENR